MVLQKSKIRIICNIGSNVYDTIIGWFLQVINVDGLLTLIAKTFKTP